MKKLIALLCIALILTFSSVGSVSALSQAELQAQIDANNEKIKDNQEKLDELKKKKDNQKDYLDALEGQIKVVEEKATNLQTQVAAIDGDIERLDSELNQLGNETKEITEDIDKTARDISHAQKTIGKKSDVLASKLRSAYINGNQSTLKILMGSESLASFMTGLELMKRTSEKDKQIIIQFKQEVTELKQTKEKLEKSRKKLAEKEAEINEKKEKKRKSKQSLLSKQKEYDSTMDNLEGQYKEIESVMENIDKSSSTYKEYIRQLELENKKADEEINKFFGDYYATQNQQTTRLPASNASPTVTAGPSLSGSGEWLWPVGNVPCYISSDFGSRTHPVTGQVSSFHGAIDIAGGSSKIYGSPVYATRAGTVIASMPEGTSYGIYVIIDHGDGYSSLYAHMCARYVDVGTYVTKGQMIGRVGNTGRSTGPHLHFEVRYYGEKKNPLNYVRKP